MTIDQKLITNLSNLAKLDIPDQETDKICNSLNNILAMVEQIQAADTSNVTTLANPLDSQQILRQDIINSKDQRQQLLSIAPDSENGLFLVPKVIE